MNKKYLILLLFSPLLNINFCNAMKDSAEETKRKRILLTLKTMNSIEKNDKKGKTILEKMQHYDVSALTFMNKDELEAISSVVTSLSAFIKTYGANKLGLENQKKVAENCKANPEEGLKDLFKKIEKVSNSFDAEAFKKIKNKIDDAASEDLKKNEDLEAIEKTTKESLEKSGITFKE